MIDILTRNIKLNGYNGSWVLKKGMGFKEENLFWGEKKKRIVPHEGIDLGFIKNNENEILPVTEKFKVHNFLRGRIVKIIQDFIGKSVFIKHDKIYGNRILHSVFGHIVTEKEKDSEVAPLEMIGTIALKKNIPCHYHYSLVLIPNDIESDMLDWKHINSLKGVEFINPLNFTL